MPIVRFKRFPVRVRVGVRLRVIGLGLVRVSDPRRIVSSAHRSIVRTYSMSPRRASRILSEDPLHWGSLNSGFASRVLISTEIISDFERAPLLGF